MVKKMKYAITNFDHWLTEDEAFERIKLFGIKAGLERNLYLKEEKKFILFFKKLHKKFSIFFQKNEDLIKINSKRYLLKEIKKALREKQNLTIKTQSGDLEIEICDDLILSVKSIFDPKQSPITEIVEASSLFILKA